MRKRKLASSQLQEQQTGLQSSGDAAEEEREMGPAASTAQPPASLEEKELALLMFCKFVYDVSARPYAGEKVHKRRALIVS